MSQRHVIMDGPIADITFHRGAWRLVCGTGRSWLWVG